MESPVGPRAVAHGGVSQENRGLGPERIEGLADEVPSRRVPRPRRKRIGRDMALPDGQERARCREAIADLEGAGIGEPETERDSALLDGLVEQLGHRAVDAAASSERAHGGVGGHVADGIDQPLLAVEKHPQRPAGIVADDLSPADGDCSEPAVRVARELPFPFFGRHLPAEHASEETSDPGSVFRRGDPDLEVLHAVLFQRSLCKGRPSAFRKIVRCHVAAGRLLRISSGRRNSSSRSAAAKGSPDGLGENATAAPGRAAKRGSRRISPAGPGGESDAALSRMALPRRP